jgi:DNA-binding PadR family transcriptional regulator
MKKPETDGPLTETAFLILLAMIEPNHGYGVMQFVEERTKGRVVFGSGTLYGAINNLNRKGWIEPCQTDSEERKKDYVITDEGLKQLKKELLRLKQICQIGGEVLKERGVEFDKKI